MKAISAKLNIRGVDVVNNNNIEKIALNIILWSFGALALSYIFLMGNMVLNIVERQGSEARARVLTNEVRNLEVTYLSMSNDVDLNLSYSMGFKETKAIFATRKSFGFAESATYSNKLKVVKNEF